MKKKIVFLLALSVILVTALTMNSTLAYFTTYAEAKGGYVLKLGGEPNMEERFEQWAKHVVITNDGRPVYVRVKAFAPSDVKLEYIGEGWAQNDDPDDDYCYYQGTDPNDTRSAIVGQGEQTTELKIQITLPDGYEPVEGESFNVIVIYESTPVQYDIDGNPYVDWNLKLEGGERE